MHCVFTRRMVQQLLETGMAQREAALHCKVSERTVRRIAKEAPVGEVVSEPAKRSVGRPSKTARWRDFVKQLFDDEPALMSLEVFRRCKAEGYSGGKSAIYELCQALRPKGQQLEMRFDGLPGEFSQHDFGQVDVRYLDGSRERVHFFASRLKFSRVTQVSLVPNEQAETLVRTLLDHFVAFGGVPLMAVFDRPKTVALEWDREGKITEWNPVFAQAALDIGFGAEVCWPRSPRQKGSVENLVGWVKGSFFKQRRFLDREDLLRQLSEWLREVNDERPSRATNVVPKTRLAEERPRLRAPRTAADALALRLPVSVGPTAYVVHDNQPYSMPPGAAGLPATLYLNKDKVRIVAGRYEATHERKSGKHPPSTLPEHRGAQLAAIHGKRGQRYLKRQHLLETGDAAVTFLTELVHKDPTHWINDVDRLHELLQRHGPDALSRAFRSAVEVGRFDARYVARCLGPQQLPLTSMEPQ